MSPQQLDQVVAPIALYPDGLLAQVLTASTSFAGDPRGRNLGKSAFIPKG